MSSSWRYLPPWYKEQIQPLVHCLFSSVVTFGTNPLAMASSSLTRPLWNLSSTVVISNPLGDASAIGVAVMPVLAIAVRATMIAVSCYDGLDFHGFVSLKEAHLPWCILLSFEGRVMERGAIFCWFLCWEKRDSSVCIVSVKSWLRPILKKEMSSSVKSLFLYLSQPTAVSYISFLKILNSRTFVGA